VARSRRPARRRSAAVLRRRPRLDWVYHDDSYSNNFVDIPSGIVGANFFTLVDSQNAMRFMRYGAVETPVAAMPMLISGEWQRPREAQLIMRAVEWYAYAAPSVWAIASVYGMGCRLMHAIQDPFTGLAGVPPAYSIWGTPAGGTGTTAAGIANVKQDNIKEWRKVAAFNTNVSAPRFEWRGFWRGRWKLMASHQFGLLMEFSSVGPTMRTSMYARTLVETPWGAT